MTEALEASPAVDPIDFLVQAARTNFAAFVAAVHRPRYRHSAFSARVCRAIDQFVEDVIAGKRPVLMLTAPPQHGKSSLISRCLPPYLMGRLLQELPAVRIACASYAQGLANRNRRDAQNIMLEPIYREIFPHASLIGFKGIDNISDGLEVPGGGWLRGVGIGGGLTGFSLDCFAPGTLVDTDAGLIPIENLHLHAKTVKVLSSNADGQLEYARIKAIGHRQATRLYRITTHAGRVLEVTGNHPVFANGRYAAAAELAPGDILVCAMPNNGDAIGSRLSQVVESLGLWASVLQQSLHGRFVSNAYTQLPRLRAPDELARRAKVPGMPSQISQKTIRAFCGAARDYLSNLRRNFYKSLEGLRRADLQPKLCSDAPLRTYVGAEQPSVCGDCGIATTAGAPPQQSGLSLCKDRHAGSGRTRLQIVPSHGETARAPHRREPAAQFVLQFVDFVRRVSQARTQADGRRSEKDTIRTIEIIDGPLSVYDLQVEKNANLFANGILAHNCGIIDDAVKNSEEALSETIQERNRDWFDSVFLTRLQQRSGVVIIGTPWSANDLIAHALKVYRGQDSLTCLSFPALNLPDELGYDPSLPAGALVPHLHDEAKLREIKRNIAAMWWAAMFQQTPLADVGAIFPRANVQHYRRAELPRQFQRVIMSVDATFKDGDTSDFVAVGVWGKTADDRVWLIDKRREQLGFMATAQAIADLRAKHRNIHRIFIEEAANGAALIDMLKKHFTNIEGVPPQGSKTARAHAVSWVWANNCVMLPHPDEDPGIAQWVAEITSFPDVKHDDTVDCMTLALQQLCLRTPIAGMITKEILSRIR